jgi:hypothetical protein
MSEDGFVEVAVAFYGGQCSQNLTGIILAVHKIVLFPVEITGLLLLLLLLLCLTLKRYLKIKTLPLLCAIHGL